MRRQNKMIIVHTVDNDEILVDPTTCLFSRMGTGCIMGDCVEDIQNQENILVLKESLEDILALLED